MAENWSGRGRTVLVLDPLASPDWYDLGAEWVTASPDEFLALAKSVQNCRLIIDECGLVIGHTAKEKMWFATTARHWGHQTTFIAQRATMLDPNIRSNCGNIFVFKVSFSDSKTLADDFADETLRSAHNLAKGEYYQKIGMSAAERLRVF